MQRLSKGNTGSRGKQHAVSSSLTLVCLMLLMTLVRLVATTVKQTICMFAKNTGWSQCFLRRDGEKNRDLRKSRHSSSDEMEETHSYHIKLLHFAFLNHAPRNVCHEARARESNQQGFFCRLFLQGQPILPLLHQWVFVGKEGCSIPGTRKYSLHSTPHVPQISTCLNLVNPRYFCACTNSPRESHLSPSRN